MSYVIANQISFSKDFSTFKVKGGDNNCYPRSNSWTKDIPIEALYYNVNGGMIQLNQGQEKCALVDYIMRTTKFADNTMDYYYLYTSNEAGTIDSHMKIAFDDFNEKFIKKLIVALKSISHKKVWIVQVDNNFVSSYGSRSTWLTPVYRGAKLLSEYRAKNLARQLTWRGAEKRNTRAIRKQI